MDISVTLSLEIKGEKKFVDQGLGVGSSLLPQWTQQIITQIW